MVNLLSTISGFLSESIDPAVGNKSFYDLKAHLPGTKGDFDFGELKGKATLIVNTASKCGYTPQFTGLEELHKEFADKGLIVLGFPSNEFAGQDPGTDEEIASFCQLNHGVTFPLMQKSEVNGKNMNDVFAWLKVQDAKGKSVAPIKWNFTKFLVDRQGNLVGRWGSGTKPEALKAEIEKVLDTTSPSQRHRAEHLSRQAAANAHASYYAHPKLHLHTYLPARTASGRVLPDSEQDGAVVEAMNGPAPSAAAHDPDQDIGKIGTKGTREEEGGKENAGKPSGLDLGAREANGEAGGTHTSPGPTAAQVEEFKATQGRWDEHNKGEKLGGLQVPGTSGDGEAKPGMTRHYSVSQSMTPHLQMLCGPLLSYYTTKDNVWQGAAMVVTADEGSVYSPEPSLALTFHPYTKPSDADPTLWDASTQLLQRQTIQAKRFFHFDGYHGNSSFWRFMIEVPLQNVEMSVRYKLNGGAEMGFVVPAIGQNLRWAAHSCNGFSSGVNPDDFKGEYLSGYDPVWEDLLLKHHEKPFHCMVGGGDQIYCDAITREPELQSWINAPDRDSKLNHPLTQEMIIAIDRFYFNHYCKIFRSNAFGRANSTVPMVNMLDDHDLIDGFGTYDDETQAAAVMSHIGSRGYFWFLIFQLFVNDEVDGTNPTPGTHPVKSMIIGDKNGPWITFPSHSLVVYLGPKVAMLALDCRAERKLSEIVRPESYKKAFNEVRKIQGLEQLVILLGVPIAYPRMSFLEHFLDFKYNPLNMLARHNAFGLGGMVNKFNQASELLDDLNDHWCANTHKKERNWLVLEVQKLALQMDVRITFLSGDVHLAAVGCLFTKVRKSAKPLLPERDHRYMLNVVTSAIVNTPPPAGAARMVSQLGSHKHRTLPMQTDEKLMPLFQKDTDGSTMKTKLVQARRNYTIVEYMPSGELIFEIRVEKSPGAGETVGYPISAPAPRWNAPDATGIKHATVREANGVNGAYGTDTAEKALGGHHSRAIRATA